MKRLTWRANGEARIMLNGIEICGTVAEIAHAPAADVAPVIHARWENRPVNGVYDMICTNCGFCPGIRFYSSEYCPNCGARMEKEDEHEAD